MATKTELKESRLLATLDGDDNELLVLRVPRDFDESKLNGLQLDLKQPYFVASLKADGADFRVHRAHNDATAHLVPLVGGANGGAQQASLPVSGMLEVIRFATLDEGARERALQLLRPSKRGLAALTAVPAAAPSASGGSAKKAEKKKEKKGKKEKKKKDKKSSKKTRREEPPPTSESSKKRLKK